MDNKVIQILTERDRAILNRVRKAVATKGITADKVQPSFLRVSQLIVNGRSQYQFQIKADSGVSLVHDQKLDQNDAFVLTHLGIGLLAEDPAKAGTGIVQTYPNNTVFAAVAGEVVPLDLNIFFNGKYRVKVDETVFAEAIATEDMMHVPTTQQSAAGNFSGRTKREGTIELTPDIMLSGSKKNEITLNVPAFSGMLAQHTTAATRNYVVFRAFGFLISGGSSLGSL